MQKRSTQCRPIKRPKRHRVTLAIDGELWEKFQPVLKEKWGQSFTTWLEYSMECYSRDSCEGCPYEPYENDGNVEKADGIAKVRDKKK